LVDQLCPDGETVAGREALGQLKGRPALREHVPPIHFACKAKFAIISGSESRLQKKNFAFDEEHRLL
jgi:hypothetical protein